MYRLATSLSSKVRVAKNSIRPVGSRNYAFGRAEIPYKRNKLPKDCDVLEGSSATIGDIAKFEKEPNANFTCDMVEEGCWLDLLYRVCEPCVGSDSRGIKYRPIVTYTLLDGLDNKGLKAQEEGYHLLYMLDDIMDSIRIACQYLRHIARPIRTYEEIFQVATTAANGDKQIGKMVAKAIEKVGKDSSFAIYGKKRSKNRLEFVNAVKVDWGFASTSFITDYRFGKCVLENPFILIHEKKILKEDVVKQAIRLKRPLLIVAEDVDLDLIRSLRQDPSCHGTKLCVVKPPHGENNGKALMQYLAVLTGGQVVTSESEMNFIPQMLGSCKEVTVSCRAMVILGGSGGQEDVKERHKQLISLISSSTWTSNYDLKLLEERLAKLSSEAAVFKVGGASEAEVDKYHCRVANAVNAAVAALENGIVASRGVALLHASKELDKLHNKDFNKLMNTCFHIRNTVGINYEKKCTVDYNRKRLGVRLVQNALKAPVSSIANAAGFDYSVVVKKLLETDNPELGYDPAKGEYTDLIRSGIVDPVLLLVDELNYLDWYCARDFEYKSSVLKDIKEGSLDAKEEGIRGIIQEIGGF